MSGARVRLSRQQGLPDEELGVLVENAPPGAAIRLRSSLTDDDGRLWRTHGLYFADLAGRIDTRTHYSWGGGYEGIDPRGLLWSLSPRGASPPSFPVWKDPFAPWKIDFTASIRRGADWRPIEGSQTYSYLPALADEIRVSQLREGRLRGVLAEPKFAKPDAPAVMVLSGSGGGAHLNTAALFASRGVTALALAYFNYEDLPAALAEIPLEYFEEGMDWLASHSRRSRIGLIGASRGGELVLLLGSVFPQRVSTVIAVVPSLHLHAGYGESGDHFVSWTLGGRALRTAPPYSGQMTEAPGGPPVSYREAFLDLWFRADQDEYAIKVERIDCPILIQSAEADEVWPSAIGGELVVQRLARHDFKHSLKHSSYSGAGHAAAYWQPIHSRSRQMVHSLTGTVLLLGGTPKATANMAVAGFSEALNWLQLYGGE